MEIALYPLTSGLHRETVPDPLEEPFIKSIEKALGHAFIPGKEDFSDYGKHDMDLIYIRTGGTENLFRKINPDGYVRLLTSGKSNSLAASMEILSWLKGSGRDGEILHGSPGNIAERLSGREERGTESSELIRGIPGLDMPPARLGVVGKPSDWLISSGVDEGKLRSKFNSELIRIPIDELTDAVLAHRIDHRSIQGSEAIYEELMNIVGKYRLDGITVRCFDLLDSIGNTGCLALARMNSEGIPAGCEGDIPALVTMMTAYRLTGFSGFQCNLSRIEEDRLLFAHCTVPFNMLSGWSFTTHFESGIGTAVKGEIPPGPVTVFKIAPDMERMVAIPARIISGNSEPDLCRTQIWVEARGAAGYFLHNPLANHHIIVPGELFANDGDGK